MATVELMPTSPISAERMASHAGRECYEKEPPAIDSKRQINVKDRLWTPGHHTTLEHAPHYYTFQVEGVSVSTITFGFHLNSSFYNSDQRSGRFSAMYDWPDTDELETRIRKYFPKEDPAPAMRFIKSGLKTFGDYKNAIADKTAKALRAERPYVTEKYIEDNAWKIGQEQLRVFVPTIAPCGFDYTLNLVSLAALWRTAWTPEMREIVGQMKDAVLANDPDISYAFEDSTRGTQDWAPNFDENLFGSQKLSPTARVLSIDMPYNHAPVIPDAKDKVDILQFHPKAMSNNTYSVLSEVQVSTMTFGQDQRHRTIDRSPPVFTKDFYVPPLVEEMGLGSAGAMILQQWLDLPYKNQALLNYIVPYGAMVKYTKRENVNAIIHEQEKRLCLAAQQEIYNLNVQFRDQIMAAGYENFAKALGPHCSKLGSCCEGPRYCGRDLAVWKNGGNGFKERGV